jgi:hypothetical protein
LDPYIQFLYEHTGCISDYAENRISRALTPEESLVIGRIVAQGGGMAHVLNAADEYLSTLPRGEPPFVFNPRQEPLAPQEPTLEQAIAEVHFPSLIEMIVDQDPQNAQDVIEILNHIPWEDSETVEAALGFPLMAEDHELYWNVVLRGADWNRGIRNVLLEIERMNQGQALLEIERMNQPPQEPPTMEQITAEVHFPNLIEMIMHLHPRNAQDVIDILNHLAWEDTQTVEAALGFPLTEEEEEEYMHVIERGADWNGGIRNALLEIERQRLR